MPGDDVEVPPSPTICRWLLGGRLREARDAAGVSMAAAGDAIQIKSGTVSKIENGRQAIKVAYVKVWAEGYRLDADTTDELVALAEGANRPEWFSDFKVPEWFRQFLGYESAASDLRTYTSELVDGLLQLRGYALEVGRVNRPGSIESELAAATALREARQERVRSDAGPAIHLVLNEAVLRRVVGGVALMKAQINYLIDRSEQEPNLAIQVLPFSAGAHPAMTTPFTMLTFDDFPKMNTVYHEIGRGASYYDSEADLDLYSWRFDRLTELALSPEETRGFMGKIANDL